MFLYPFRSKWVLNILKYILVFSICFVFLFSYSLPASAHYVWSQNLQDHITLEFVNLYVFKGSSFDDGNYIAFDGFTVGKYHDGYAFDINIADSSSDWVLNGYYNMRLVFKVDFYDIWSNYSKPPSDLFKFDYFSTSLYGQWLPVDDLKSNSTLFKIYRKFPDAYYADTFHWYQGSTSFSDGGSVTDSKVNYTLPSLESFEYMDQTYSYEIILDFSFKNDVSSSTSRNYRFYLNPFVYTFGDSEQELSIYPSFDSSVTDSFEQSESKALDSAHNLLDPAADEVLNPEIFNPDNQFMKGYIAAAKILNKFTEIPFINRLFKFSVVFGYVAVVLGIVYVAVGRSIRRG